MVGESKVVCGKGGTGGMDVKPYITFSSVWNTWALWNGSQKQWVALGAVQREEHRRANQRTQHRRIVGNLKKGQKVWLWNTKAVTLREKLEPWWVGPRILLDRIARLVWKVWGSDGRYLDLAFRYAAAV